MQCILLNVCVINTIRATDTVVKKVKHFLLITNCLKLMCILQ